MAKRTLLLFSLCLLALARPVHADTIGPVCGSCFGSSYTLSYSSTGNPDAFNVFLTIDATGYTGTNSNLLNAVALKLVSMDSQISSVSLVSPIPAGFSNPVSITGLNANGCSGGGGGFFCSESSLGGLQVGHSGDIYTFQWLVTVGAPGDLLADKGEASVKALYVTQTGQQDGITSEGITLTPGAPMPEPPSFLTHRDRVARGGWTYPLQETS
jgi:hypothetical protein